MCAHGGNEGFCPICKRDSHSGHLDYAYGRYDNNLRSSQFSQRQQSVTFQQEEKKYATMSRSEYSSHNINKNCSCEHFHVDGICMPEHMVKAIQQLKEKESLAAVSSLSYKSKTSPPRSTLRSNSNLESKRHVVQN